MVLKGRLLLQINNKDLILVEGDSIYFNSELPHGMKALDGEKVIGIGSIRSKNHLSLLFVEEAYHRRGVGRAIMNALFSYLKEEAGEKFISVQAAPYAVNFYKKLGFHTVRPEQEISGIRVTAMEKIF